MKADLVVTGGDVVLGSGRVRADLAIAGGRIAKIGSDVGGAVESLDARGLVVLPGLVDGHVHFNEPGRSDWEGWEAGTRGAAAGGVTTVCEMPLNAHPPTTTAAAFDEKLAAASKTALVDFGLWGGFVGQPLEHLDALHAKGVVAFKSFLSDSGIEDFPRVSDDQLREGLTRVAALGALLGVHTESHEMTDALGKQFRAAGRTDRAAWTLSRPPAAELEAMGRLLGIGREVGPNTRLLVVHVSTADGLAKLESARYGGRRAMAETCPHYLWFTADGFERIGPSLKCAPPVRDAANRERMWRGLLAGQVSVIGSDHSPCPAAAKQRGETDIWQAWGGVSGIQLTLPVLLTEGVHRRGLPWAELAELTAAGPARLYGLAPHKGAIAVGADADLALVDPDRQWTFTREMLQTRSGISPYLGAEFQGAVVRTIVRGRTVFADGQVVGTPGYGRFVARGTHAH